MKQLENSFEMENTKRISFSNPKIHKQETTANLKQEDDKSSENNMFVLLTKKNSYDSFNSNIQHSKNSTYPEEKCSDLNRFSRPVSASSSMSKGVLNDRPETVYNVK